MTRTILFILACLILPIAWGWLVHALFRYFSNKRGGDDQDGIFPDFQI